MIVERIKENKPVIIDFYTSTCSICTVLDQSLAKVEEHYGERLDVVKINVDQDKVNTIHFDATYKIMGVPTLMLFKNNQLIWTYNGALFPEDLIQRIDQFID